MMVEKCPCCSDLDFAACCQPLLEGKTNAQTPLALMRSRYTAHVLKNMRYILKTMQGKALKLFDQETTQNEWFDRAVWNKLEIIDAHDNIVEFKAFYSIDNEVQTLHERSKFEKINGIWYFIAGQNLLATIHTSDKIGRNDPCSCGSGKKFKKCCG